MLIIDGNQGKRYNFATHINDMLLPREECEAIEVFKVIIEPGLCTHRHTHNDTEQVYFIISGYGHIAITVPAEINGIYHLVPDTLAHVPRNAEHQVFCDSDNEPLVYLCVDSFPEGKPDDEQTWDQHYDKVIDAQMKG